MPYKSWKKKSHAKRNQLAAWPRKIFLSQNLNFIESNLHKFCIQSRWAIFNLNCSCLSFKLRWLNRPGPKFWLKSWPNRLLIKFFDLNSWNLIELLRQNRLKAVQIWFKKVIKLIDFVFFWLILPLFDLLIDIRNDFFYLLIRFWSKIDGNRCLIQIFH